MDFNSTHLHLFIKDVLAAPFPTNSGSDYFVEYCYKDHTFCKVDLAGFIVEVDYKEKFNAYRLDDGSSSIRVVHWKKKMTNQHQNNNLPPSLRNLSLVVKKNEFDEEEGYSLGDYIHVRGHIKHFREQREINANSIEVLADPNAQTMNILDRLRLYKTVYDVPVRNEHNLSVLVATNEIDCSLIYKKITSHIETLTLAELTLQKLKSLIVSELKEAKIEIYDADDEKRLNTITNKIVADLQKNGYIYRNLKCKETFSVAKICCSLKEYIKNLLTEDSRSMQCSKGVHIQQILGQMKKNLAFSEINLPCVLRCLSYLEEQSEIISVSDKHYTII